MEPPQRKIYDFFRDTHNLIRFDSPSVSKLTTRQESALLIVQDPKDWYSYAPIIETEVNDYGLLSFDFEWYGEHTDCSRLLPSMRNDWNFQRRIVFVHFATASGKTCFFDLEKMRGGNPVDPMHPLQSLPDVFLPWLRDPTVIKVGSEISVDVLASKLTVRGTVDTSRIFAEYQKEERGKIIDVGVTAKTGTGIQSFWCKNCDFRPMPRHKYEKTYGASPYPDWQGHRVWPLFRRAPQIYKWPKKLDGSYQDDVLFYNFHDATTQIGMPCKLFLEDTERSGRCVIGVNDTVESTIFKYLGEFKVGIEESVSMELEGDEDWDAEVDKIIHDGDYDECFDDVSTSGEAVPPTKKRRKSSLRQITGQAPAYACHWGRDIDRNNPYQYTPVWGRRCEFCGVGGHSLIDTRGVIMCPRRKDISVGATVCQYPSCGNKADHMTVVCPVLHQVCYVCLHRGHGEEDHCESWSRKEWQEKKDLFELYAGDGLFTRRRHHDDRWGFYAARFGSPYPYPVFYRDLINMTVAAADELLTPQREHVRVSAKGLRMVGPKNEPQPGDASSSGRFEASKSAASSSGSRRPPPPAAPPSAHSYPHRASSTSTRRSALERLGPRVSSPEPGTSRHSTSSRPGTSRSPPRSGRSGRRSPSPRPSTPGGHSHRSRSDARKYSPRGGSSSSSSKSSSSDDSVKVVKVVEGRKRRDDDDPDYRPTARKSFGRSSAKRSSSTKK